MTSIPILISRIVLSLVTFVTSIYALTFEEVLDAAPVVRTYTQFKKGLAFHCAPEEAIFEIRGNFYEISGLRVLGLEGSNAYKDFQDLIQNLNIAQTTSRSVQPYSNFPNKTFELFLINYETPKITIYFALNPTVQQTPQPPITKGCIF